MHSGVWTALFVRWEFDNESSVFSKIYQNNNQVFNILKWWIPKQWIVLHVIALIRNWLGMTCDYTNTGGRKPVSLLFQTGYFKKQKTKIAIPQNRGQEEDMQRRWIVLWRFIVFQVDWKAVLQKRTWEFWCSPWVRRWTKFSWVALGKSSPAGPGRLFFPCNET